MAVQKAKIKKFEVEKVEGTLDFELGDETFHCRPSLNGLTLIEFVRGVQRAQEDSEEGSNIEVLELLLGILKDAMGPTEYSRFTQYLNNPEINVPMETVLGIAQYLIEEYTSSPTEAS